MTTLSNIHSKKIKFISFIFVFYFVVAPSTFAFNLSQSNLFCSNNSVSYDLKSPLKLCENPNQIRLFEGISNSCVNKNTETLVLRREQLKILFNSEMFLLSRVPSWNNQFEKLWKNAQERWTARLKSEKELLDFDRQKTLGPDRCFLHHITGKICDEDTLTVNLIRAQKFQSQKNLVNRAARRKLPVGLLFDLFEMILMEQAFQGSDLSAVKNLIYVANPELKESHFLHKLLLELSEHFGFSKKLFNRLELAKKAGQDQTFEDITTEVLEILRGTLSDEDIYKKIKFQEKQIEGLFFKSLNRLVKNMDLQYLKGRSDVDWLFNQQYLVLNAFHLSGYLGLENEIRTYQSLLCTNIQREKRFQNTIENIQLFGGLVALTTGAGLFLDLGAEVTMGLLVSTLGLVNGLSLMDLYLAWDRYSQQKAQFGSQLAQPENLNDAEKDLYSTIPWTVINLALVAPSIIINDLKSAIRVAKLTNNLERLKKLKMTLKILVGLNMAAGFTLAGYMDKEVYDFLKSDWESHETLITNKK